MEPLPVTPHSVLLLGLHHPYQPRQTEPQPDLDQEGAYWVSHSTELRFTRHAFHMVRCVGAHPLSTYLSNVYLFTNYYMPDSSSAGDTAVIRTDENAYPQGTYILANKTAFTSKVPALCHAPF